MSGIYSWFLIVRCQDAFRPRRCPRPSNGSDRCTHSPHLDRVPLRCPLINICISRTGLIFSTIVVFIHPTTVTDLHTPPFSRFNLYPSALRYYPPSLSSFQSWFFSSNPLVSLISFIPSLYGSFLRCVSFPRPPLLFSALAFVRDVCSDKFGDVVDGLRTFTLVVLSPLSVCLMGTKSLPITHPHYIHDIIAQPRLKDIALGVTESPRIFKREMVVVFRAEGRCSNNAATTIGRRGKSESGSQLLTCADVRNLDEPSFEELTALYV